MRETKVRLSGKYWSLKAKPRGNYSSDLGQIGFVFSYDFRVGQGGEIFERASLRLIHNRQTLHPQGSIYGCPRADGKVPS